MAFLLLLVIPLLLWLKLRRRGHGSISFSSIANAMRAGRSLRQRLLALPSLLRMVALILLIVALARPQQGRERVRDLSKGVAIEMVVDRSSSMRAEMMYAGESMTRLDVVKRVFADFVNGNGRTLEGRPNDLIGMVAFARYADTICPLTLGHGALAHFLEGVQLVQRRSEDGTAIGDALAVAAARLKVAEQTLAQQSGDKEKNYEIKSKIIILLTDGENNCGKRSVDQAAQRCAEWGIKVYTIGVGSEEAVHRTANVFGSFFGRGGPTVDTRTLKALAKMTGGIFRLAEDAKSLEEVYREIDELERSEVESVRYMDYREVFVPFALAALGLVVLEVILRCTVFRRVP